MYFDYFLLILEVFVQADDGWYAIDLAKMSSGFQIDAMKSEALLNGF